MEQVDLCQHIQCREHRLQSCPPCSWQAWTLWQSWTHRPAGKEGRYFHIPVAWTSSAQSFHLPTEHCQKRHFYFKILGFSLFKYIWDCTLLLFFYVLFFKSYLTSLWSVNEYVSFHIFFSGVIMLTKGGEKLNVLFSLPNKIVVVIRNNCKVQNIC